MPYYKDQNGRPHFLDDAKFAHLLPDGCEEISDEAAAVLQAPSLDDIKASKRNEVRAAYAVAADAPVLTGGVTWDGGFDSAIKLDAARRLAESAGQPDVTFYSSDNQAHVLDFAAALQVVIAVDGAFQSVLATKQTLMRAIDDAQTASDVSLVEWPQ